MFQKNQNQILLTNSKTQNNHNSLQIQKRINRIQNVINSILNQQYYDYQQEYENLYEFCRQSDAQQLIKKTQTLFVIHIQSKINQIMQIITSKKKRQEQILIYGNFFKCEIEIIQEISDLFLYFENQKKSQNLIHKNRQNQVISYLQFKLCSVFTQKLIKPQNSFIVEKIAFQFLLNRNPSQKFIQILDNINFIDIQGKLILSYFIQIIANQYFCLMCQKIQQFQIQMKVLNYLRFVQQELSVIKKNLKVIYKQSQKKKIKLITKRIFQHLFKDNFLQKIISQLSSFIFGSEIWITLNLIIKYKQQNLPIILTAYNQSLKQQIRSLSQKQSSQLSQKNQGNLLNSLWEAYKQFKQFTNDIKSQTIKLKIEQYFSQAVNNKIPNLSRLILQEVKMLGKKVIQLKTNEKPIKEGRQMCFTFFKMIKDKIQFQKLLRKSIIQAYLFEEESSSQHQFLDTELLKLFSIQCSEQYVAKIKQVKIQIQKQKHQKKGFRVIPLVKVLFLEHSVWPFENQSIQSNSKYFDSMIKREQLRLSKIDGQSQKRILWSCSHGLVKLKITFLNGYSCLFTVPNIMANFLLYFCEHKNFTLLQFLKARGYKFQHIQTQIKKLIKSKIILINNSTLSQTSQFSLNQKFTSNYNRLSLLKGCQQKQQKYVQNNSKIELSDIVLEAICIKLLKKQKNLKQILYISQIKQQILKRTPDQRDQILQKRIQKCLQKLSAKQYIQLTKQNTYIYLP